MRIQVLRKFMALFLTLALTLGIAPAFAAQIQHADSVYRNANIYTVDEENPHATALAVVDGKLVYVGDEAGVDAWIGPNTQVTDLSGKTVLPGFVEGHLHFTSLGTNKLIIDAFWKPKQMILDAVKAAAEKAEPGEWIQGRGWMNTVWDDPSYPTKEDLDAVAPNNPVFLTRACGHMGWANSMAFELAEITKDTANPQGGEYLKNAQGELDGSMTDTAMSPIRKLIPAWSEEKQLEGILLAQEELFSYGITSCMDAGTSINNINQYKQLYESGQLKVRLYPMISVGSLDSEAAEYVKNTKPTDMLYDDRMSVKSVKLMIDGSLGARSAAMLAEYTDRPGHIGDYRYTDDQLNDIVKMCYDAGYQIASHAIGDGANHQVINAYEAAIKANPREDHRLRIEHFQIVDPDDIDRTIALGIIPSMQQTHATSDLLMAEDRVGSVRIKTSYAWRTILDKGSIIAGGSDAPVEMVNPYHGLYAGVTRQSRDGTPEGGWYAEQKMTRMENLQSFTIWSAHAQFEEEIKGSLEVGKLADFQVIDRDYMTCPENDIKDIQTLMTVCGGEVVFVRDNSQPTVMWSGVPISFTDPVLLENGVTYANAAVMAGNMSAEYEKTGNSAKLSLNGKSVTLPIKTVDGIDYVAVRALFEGLDYTVTWYPLSQTVSVAR